MQYITVKSDKKMKINFTIQIYVLYKNSQGINGLKYIQEFT